MRKLMAVLAAVAFLAGASCLYAEAANHKLVPKPKVDVTVIPNGVCSWDDLVRAEIFVSIEGQGSTAELQGKDDNNLGIQDRITIKAGPLFMITDETWPSSGHRVFSIVLSRGDVTKIRKHRKGLWESEGYFPVWVFLRDIKQSQGTDPHVAKQISVQHVVVDPAFPCLKRYQTDG